MADKKTVLFTADNTVLLKDGVPFNTAFNDIYYHKDQGLEESQTVFIKGANIEDTWQDKNDFSIGETGFGTGLNFIATLAAFLNSPSPPKRLTFFSFDHTPLSRSFLASAHQAAGVPQHLSDTLIDQLPPAVPGLHIRHFLGNRVTLYLYYGEAKEALAKLSAPQDAWYLDGFSPSQNEGMWHEDILARVVELTKQHGRIATFTAAGFVRRALEKAGCHVERVKGFGNKRHRTIATRLANTRPSVSEQTPTSDQRWDVPPLQNGCHIAVIGTGIAGLCLAHALKRYDFQVTLIEDPAKPPASCVPAAILAPRLPIDLEQPRVHLMACAFAYCLSFEPYQPHFMAPKGLTLQNESGNNNIHRMIDAHDWGPEWWQKTKEGAFLPLSGTLNTQGLLAEMRSPFKALQGTVTKHTISDNRCILSLETMSGLIDHSFDAAIVATAAPNLLPKSLQSVFSKTAGQTLWINPSNAPTNTDHAFMKGYYLSPTDPTRGQRLLGATRTKESGFENQDPAPLLSHRIEQQLPPSAPADIWSGQRFEARDHMPIVGPLWHDQELDPYLAPLAKDGKATLTGRAPLSRHWYCFTGFGSRGYQYAPFLAEQFSSYLANKYTIKTHKNWKIIHPVRIATKIRKTGKSLMDL